MEEVPMPETYWTTRFWLPAGIDRQEFLETFRSNFPDGSAVFQNVEAMPASVRLLFHPAVSPLRRRELSHQLRPTCFVFDLKIRLEEDLRLDHFLWSYASMYGSPCCTQKMGQASEPLPYITSR